MKALPPEIADEMFGLRSRITAFQRHASTSRQEIIHLRVMLARREQEILNLRQQLDYERSKQHSNIANSIAIARTQ